VQPIAAPSGKRLHVLQIWAYPSSNLGASIYHTRPPAAWDLNPSNANLIGIYNMLCWFFISPTASSGCGGGF